jgi:hypothetical protein
MPGRSVPPPQRGPSHGGRSVSIETSGCPLRRYTRLRDHPRLRPSTKCSAPVPSSSPAPARVRSSSTADPFRPGRPGNPRRGRRPAGAGIHRPARYANCANERIAAMELRPVPEHRSAATAARIPDTPPEPRKEGESRYRPAGSAPSTPGHPALKSLPARRSPRVSPDCRNHESGAASHEPPRRRGQRGSTRPPARPRPQVV